MIIKANEYCFFDRNSIGTLCKFRRYYGVKNNTYAGTTIGRLYDFYFGNAYRIRKLYREYYHKEFPSCKEFLICRFNLSQDLAQRVVDKNLFCTNMKLKIDKIVDSFNYDDELVQIFIDYVGGIQYEN